MATYAVGDIQGCYEEFARFIEMVNFDPHKDRLWLLGDLINRGPANLAVVRLVMSLGDAAVTVLGNHDLHFLAICRGGHSPNRSDTFTDLLDVDDLDRIVDWYRRQPLVVVDETLGFAMVHAGIPHLWALEEAMDLAGEVEAVIRSDEHVRYFTGMYGNKPNRWDPGLEDMDRWRSITNYFTRMRLLEEDGTMDFSHKGALSDAPESLIPWYELRAGSPLEVNLLFGHWAAIEGETCHADIIGLDTGCVWGRELTALCLETGKFFSVPAKIT